MRIFLCILRILVVLYAILVPKGHEEEARRAQTGKVGMFSGQIVMHDQANLVFVCICLTRCRTREGLRNRVESWRAAEEGLESEGGHGATDYQVDQDASIASDVENTSLCSFFKLSRMIQTQYQIHRRSWWMCVKSVNLSLNIFLSLGMWEINDPETIAAWC